MTETLSNFLTELYIRGEHDNNVYFKDNGVIKYD